MLFPARLSRRDMWIVEIGQYGHRRKDCCNAPDSRSHLLAARRGVIPHHGFRSSPKEKYLKPTPLPYRGALVLAFAASGLRESVFLKKWPCPSGSTGVSARRGHRVVKMPLLDGGSLYVRLGWRRYRYPAASY